MSDIKHTGGCLCGAIRYETRDCPVFKGTCHCRMCQQWTGTPMLSAAAFDTTAVTFTKGSPKVYQSSAVSERGFCPECGSCLFTRYFSGGDFDRLTHIMQGTLDNPEIGQPHFHYGAESELSWMHREDGIPRIRIDVDDPAEQNALFAQMIASAASQTK